MHQVVLEYLGSPWNLLIQVNQENLRIKDCNWYLYICFVFKIHQILILSCVSLFFFLGYLASLPIRPSSPGSPGSPEGPGGPKKILQVVQTSPIKPVDQ